MTCLIKLLFTSILTSIIFISCKSDTNNALHVEVFNVYKSTTGNVCRVQRPNERPLFGAKHLGPYSTKSDAEKAMCKDLDADMSNQSKCWTCIPDNICKSNLLKTNISNLDRNFNYFASMRVIKQSKKMDCWATALTMSYSWKTGNNSISVIDLLNIYGEPYPEIYKSDLGSTAKELEVLCGKANLKVIKGLNPSIVGWYDILKDHGPLVIIVDAVPPKNNIHALIINGINGKGDADNTIISFIDPADGKQHSTEFVNFIKLYEGSSNWPLQIMHWP